MVGSPSHFLRRTSEAQESLRTHDRLDESRIVTTERREDGTRIQTAIGRIEHLLRGRGDEFGVRLDTRLQQADVVQQSAACRFSRVPLAFEGGGDAECDERRVDRVPAQMKSARRDQHVLQPLRAGGAGTEGGDEVRQGVGLGRLSRVCGGKQFRQGLRLGEGGPGARIGI